jgi:hypothetical protein
VAFRNWEVSKIEYCEHAGHEIALEAELVYPAEWLPDQPARLIARRCSNALACNGTDKPGCVWCGTNPDHRPILVT